MHITASLIDDITRAFLAALQAGGQSLAVYSLGLLGILATISYYREYGMIVMSGTGLGDALAGFLVYVLTLMGYYWLIVNLFPIANAALGTAFQWALEGSGRTLTLETINTPSFIMETGLKAAFPMAEQATWFGAIKQAFKLVNHPGDLIAYWLVVLSFLAITAHHVMMLIEYHLAVMCAAVLIPFAVWRTTESLGEFIFGWLTGAVIRALVSVAVLGIATPLFALLNRPAEGFITLYNTVMLVGGSFLFSVLAWIIPARAAGIAGRGMALALHGGALMAQAMSFSRFGMIVHGVSAAATRATSAMIQSRHMVPASRP